MRGGRQNQKSNTEKQREKLKTPLLDLGPEANEVSVSNGKRLIYRSPVMARLVEEVAI
jgi:hypothetical protein